MTPGLSAATSGGALGAVGATEAWLAAAAAGVLVVGVVLLRLLERRIDAGGRAGPDGRGVGAPPPGAPTTAPARTVVPRARRRPAATDEVVAAADAALRAAATARATGAVPVPRAVLVAAEALTTASGTGPGSPPPSWVELVRVLAADPSVPTSVRRHVVALDRALLLTPTWSLAEVADVAADALGRGSAPGEVEDVVPLTLAHAAGDAAAIWADRRRGPGASAVASVVLSTWPGRTGLLDGAPLVVGPSLAACRSGAFGPPDVGVLLGAVTGAATSQAAAERSYAAAVRRVVGALRDVVPPGPAQALEALLSTSPVVALEELAAGTGEDQVTAERFLRRAASSGVLTAVEPTDAIDGRPPTWVAPALLDALAPLLGDVSEGAGAASP